MTQDPDEERIRRKAHELWVAEGHPHGRDQDHWDQAKEIVAIEDSQSSTLLPWRTGAEEPIEPSQAVENLGDLPNLTDQGEHPLTDVSREPEALSPAAFINAMGDTAGGVARPVEEQTPGVDDREIVSRPPMPELVTGKPAAAVTTPAGPAGAAAKAASRGRAVPKVAADNPGSMTKRPEPSGRRPKK